MTLVKICGIREEEHARTAAEAGADLIGFVFVPVRRQISSDSARHILRALRQESGTPPAAVGLFVNECAERINQIAGQVQLDFVQLCGDEPPELARSLDPPAIKALRLAENSSLDDARFVIERHLRYAVGVLVDSHVSGQWGGTGVLGDWDIAARLAEEFPIVLAGGLNPENVSQAIEQVRPAVVDVSSGVEIDGRKDSDRIRAFVKNARSAPVTPALSEQCRQLTQLISGAWSHCEPASEQV